LDQPWRIASVQLRSATPLNSFRLTARALRLVGDRTASRHR
jgi:hypothetical protein